jgi:DNA-binding CsgD family transcriptional regulator
MKAWPLPNAAPLPETTTRMVAALGRPEFAAQALEAVNQSVAAGSWSVYQVWPDRAPVMHFSACRLGPDVTHECFAIYRDQGLYRRDLSFEAVRTSGRPGHAMVLCMHADDTPSTDHREAIYLRHGLLERLSVARLEADGSLMAVNFYHHQPQGCFDPAEVERFAQLAPLLLACVTRQLQWQTQTPFTAVRDRLLARCPSLTARELDVLERLLQGLSYDGIAADLGLSVASVKTYRARAFARLGLHFKSQLFAAFMP